MNKDHEYLRDFITKNDEAALAEIISQHTAMIYSYANRQLSDSGLAEDVTQSVFIILIEKAKKVPTNVPLSAWLYSVTKYVVANARRKEMNRIKFETLAGEEKMIDSEEEDYEDWSAHLDEVISSLSEKDRHLICMRYFDELSLKNIGDSLKIKESAVSRRLKRVLDKMEKRLAIKGIAISALSLANSLQADLVNDVSTITVDRLKSSVLNGFQSGSYSDSVLTLSQGAIKMMTIIKIKKITLAAILMTVLFGVAFGVLTKLDQETEKVSKYEESKYFKSPTIISDQWVKHVQDNSTWYYFHYQILKSKDHKGKLVLKQKKFYLLNGIPSKQTIEIFCHDNEYYTPIKIFLKKENLLKPKDFYENETTFKKKNSGVNSPLIISNSYALSVGRESFPHNLVASSALIPLLNKVSLEQKNNRTIRAFDEDMLLFSDEEESIQYVGREKLRIQQKSVNAHKFEISNSPVVFYLDNEKKFLLSKMGSVNYMTVSENEAKKDLDSEFFANSNIKHEDPKRVWVHSTHYRYAFRPIDGIPTLITEKFKILFVSEVLDANRHYIAGSIKIRSGVFKNDSLQGDNTFFKNSYEYKNNKNISKFSFKDYHFRIEDDGDSLYFQDKKYDISKGYKTLTINHEKQVEVTEVPKKLEKVSLD